MSKFEDQLARMQGLMNYGIVSESEEKKSIDIEHQALGADGKSYAIIKENAKYVIKSADADKANIVESYNYVDGWNHISDHSYDSYAEASKQFDMKMSSLNEAYSKDIKKENLNSFMNESYMTEGTEDMLSEIARQRQIMHNAAVIMNEASEISMNNTSDPERKSGNSGDMDAPFTDKAEASLDKDPKQASGKPENMGDPYGDTKETAKGKDIQGPDGSVASQHPTGGKVARVNEDTMPSGEIKDEGLPETPGTGNVNEESEDDFEVMDHEDDVPEISPESEDEIDSENNADMDSLEDVDFEDDEDLDDEDFDDEDIEDDEDSIESLRAEIEELQARLDALEDNEEGEDLSDEDLSTEDELSDEDFSDEEDLANDEDLDSEAASEEDPEDEGEFPEEDEEEFDPDSMIESIVKNVSTKILAENKKKAYMESIVNSVVKGILTEGAVNEEKTELHDFGKHPGYRKKPMELPETGSDEFQGNKDWNDESVHTEQPFGQGKGDSKPYKDIQKVVDSITEEVMQAIKKKA